MTQRLMHAFLALRARLTLGGLFYLCFFGLAVLFCGLFLWASQRSRQYIIEDSQRQRAEISMQIEDHISNLLSQAQAPLDQMKQLIRAGVCESDTRLGFEPCLLSALLANSNLVEVTLTHAIRAGENDPLLAREGRWQLSAILEKTGEETPNGTRPVTRTVWGQADHFISERRLWSEGSNLRGAPFVRDPNSVPDPTVHKTFSAPYENASADVLGTDLSYTELDSHLPESERRVVLSFMKLIVPEGGRTILVARVSLLTTQIGEMVEAERSKHKHHHIFIADKDGRLVTRLGPRDPLVLQGDDLRVVPAEIPPEVDLALKHGPPKGHDGDVQFDEAMVGGRRFLVSSKELAGTQDWRLWIVVPEDNYSSQLRSARNGLLGVSASAMMLILFGGAAALRAVRRALGQIVNESVRMHRFLFGPTPAVSPFRDVRETLSALEQAKTALRAMGKYVPIDLVRELFGTNREPRLGGVIQDVSLMFTDIQDFTAIAERLSPDELAQALGRYFEAMTLAIQGTNGIVDKYIGDAVMAIWNAPKECAAHPVKACHAALACLEATQELYASTAWEGRPTLHTRFGLHRDEVMVGHFGAQSRMNFTAIGDGVNIASRLEGLNKQYGTTIIASETIYSEAKALFNFRRLDTVVVKGRTKGIGVYELLSEAGSPEPRLALVRSYEAALDFYRGREFARAVGLLEGQLGDPPSRLLMKRCQLFLSSPPPPEWTGEWTWSMK